MKRWGFFVFLAPLLSLFFFLSTPRGNAQSATQNFTLDNFTADYYLSRNSQKAPLLKVDEILVAQFPDFDQNHGILRAIPLRYQDHTLSLTIDSVTDENGQPYSYSIAEQNDNLVLKIGDASSYVRGLKTYKISYQMRNVINYQSDHEEFYWDINGDQWPQAFGSVTARIHIPADLKSALQDRQACYAGAPGSMAANCNIDRIDENGGSLITASATELQPYQTLSVVTGFNKDTFVPGPEIAKEQRDRKIKLIAATAGALLPPVLAGWVMFKRWRQFGDDPKGRGVIIPEYEPPKGFGVLDSDFILQQKLRNEAISAMLIDLAVKRYLTIYEIPKKGLFGSKDYELELNRSIQEFSGDVLAVLKLVFDDKRAPGARVKLSDYKKDIAKRTEFYDSLKKIESSLADKLFRKCYFIKDPKKIKSSYLSWAGLPFVAGIGLFWVAIAAGSIVVGGLGLGLFLAAIIMALFAKIMPARSRSGVQANDDLLGLKDYIKMAEADRLKYLQSPEGAEKIVDKNAFDPKTAAAKVKLFEKLLPYAMLFGLERDWAKQFKDLYTQPPDWYNGNWTAFNIVYLSSSLGDFSKSTGQVFTSPSSSSGSGFGGGSSGGGGGGGGGGGW